jgi:hypothetical protein
MVANVTNERRCSLLSLDFGNFELKSFDGQSVTKIRSLQRQLGTGQVALKATETSPIVEMSESRWHIGSQAGRYSSFEATVEGDKTKLAQLHLAACIGQSGRYELVVAHHSPSNYSDFLKSALLGRHSYVRNGKTVDAIVSAVTVVLEGSGAYELARLRSYVPTRGYTIVIDLGGSTWLSSLYAADGELVDSSSHERQGTYALAAAIAADSRLQKPLQSSTSVSAPDVSLILEGLAKDHYYGESEICWAEWLEEYLSPWWKGITQSLKSKYQTYLPSVKRFIITGGGANLVSAKVAASPAFLVMPDSSTANVQGAFFSAQSRALV